ASSRVRTLVCLLLLVAAAIAVARPVNSSHGISQGGSTSPQADAKRMAEGANISSESFRRPAGQRVEDNAFHLKIAPWVIEQTANGQQAELFVVLKDQADLSGAVALATKAEKGRYVYGELRNNIDRKE